MDSKRSAAVGVFVLVGLLCVAYMTIKLGKMEVFSDEGFELKASFTNVSGLRVGADIEMAGVPVGKVAAIELVRSETQTTAMVTLRFERDLQLPDDTIASVRTAGLIGDKFLTFLRHFGDTRKDAQGVCKVEEKDAIDDAENENEREMGDSAIASEHIAEHILEKSEDKWRESIVVNDCRDEPHNGKLRANDAENIALHIAVVP